MRKENTLKKFKWNAVSGITGGPAGRWAATKERGDTKGF